MDASIRPATPADADAIAALYGWHVLNATATFEEVPPDAAEMARRQAAVTSLGLPYLVAEDRGGRLLGYAYAGRFHARSAYRFTLEDSIYLDPAATGQGLGRRLLDRLVTDAAAAGARQMIAIIGDSGNAASIALHTRAGFTPIGSMRAVGFKFGRWLDTVSMQLPLGPGDTDLP